MKVNFKKLHNDAVIPSYAHATDAGLDLTAVSFTQEFDKSGKLTALDGVVKVIKNPNY